MGEFPPGHERESQDITRQQVIAAFEALSGDGNLDPADLDLDDPSVIAANDLFYTWQEQVKSQANTQEKYLQFEVQATTLFVEAGFLDSNYLDEVANDWLVQTQERVEDAGLTSLTEEIGTKIKEINEIIAQTEENSYS